MEPRKTQIIRERSTRDLRGRPCAPVTRVVAMAVLDNPYAGTSAEDLSQLFDAGGRLGAQLTEMALAELPGPAVSYGKAAIVGTDGDFEHGGALIHPRLGKPMRAGVGGGKALIPSNVKVAGPGAALDLPLGHKDEGWSFDHFDTVTVALGDAPLPHEIVLILGIADGARLWPRCGDGPITD
ncbi:MAG: amino acid synthesis family protein [Pseudomonadota bacterium]